MSGLGLAALFCVAALSGVIWLMTDRRPPPDWCEGCEGHEREQARRRMAAEADPRD